MSGVISHNGLPLSGLRLSDGDYGFIPNGSNGRTIAYLTNTNTPSYTN